MVRAPDFIQDGWRLHSGEEHHSRARDTFPIPPLEDRQGLQIGDLAKLIFEINVESDNTPQVERMWVIVRERTVTGYLGILDNDPYCIAENDTFWSGIELPFGPEHVIAIAEADQASIAIANQKPSRYWE